MSLFSNFFNYRKKKSILNQQNNRNWRREFMTLDLKIQEECNKAFKMGEIRKSCEVFLKLLSSGMDMATAQDIVGISPEQAAEFLETK